MAEERAATSIDRKLGQRIRSRRLELGLSQAELGDILGVTFQQVQKYEKGANRIAAGRLVEVAAALDLPIAELFAGLVNSTKQSSARNGVDHVLATPEGVDLVRLFGAIKSARVRRRVVDLVRVLTEQD